MYGARGETRRAFASRSPGLRAHGALATLRYKQATGLFAQRSARSREFGTKKGASTPLNALLHVWCPRRDSKGLRFAKPRASGAWRPRHAPLQTGHRPVCLTLRALTRVRHEKGGLNPLERSFACMVPEARLELARCCQRWILSPLRLPIPPLGHVLRELVYHSFP